MTSRPISWYRQLAVALLGSDCHHPVSFRSGRPVHEDDREIGVKESPLLSTGYISIALVFGAWLWWHPIGVAEE